MILVTACDISPSCDTLSHHKFLALIGSYVQYVKLRRAGTYLHIERELRGPKPRSDYRIGTSSRHRSSKVQNTDKDFTQKPSKVQKTDKETRFFASSKVQICDRPLGERPGAYIMMIFTM